MASIHFDPPEVNGTQWTLIEEGRGNEDGRVIYCYSQEQLDNELMNCLHTAA